MATATKNRKSKSTKSRYIGKPGGLIQQRVQQAGPQQFAVISVDCAKRRSKWMLTDFYGKVVIEPTIVEHTVGAFKTMIAQIKEAMQDNKLTDSIAAVEMTGVYHRPVQAALRKAGFDTRTVHPFASEHYRQTLHTDIKTDDHDLEAMFHAAINGYGLAILPVDNAYQTLQALVRHRRNLVRQGARLQIQIRVLMHQTMPGFADLFEDDKLFHKSVALHVAKRSPGQASVSPTKRDASTRFSKVSTLDAAKSNPVPSGGHDLLKSALLFRGSRIRCQQVVRCISLSQIGVVGGD